MKQMLLILPLLTVGCTTQPTQDTTQQPSAQAYLPYAEVFSISRNVRWISKENIYVNNNAPIPD